jgi:hypothetical protein
MDAPKIPSRGPAHKPSARAALVVGHAVHRAAPQGTSRGGRRRASGGRLPEWTLKPVWGAVPLAQRRRGDLN